MEPYLYQPLLAGSNSIRLLEILPGINEAEIRCRLHRRQLPPKPELVPQFPDDGYEALSYVWGDPNNTHSILVDVSNGVTFVLHVTTNLYAALRRLRNHQTSRLMWIDAICINQKDVHEREEQVQIMASIYSCATRVVVWLGDRIDLTTSEVEGPQDERSVSTNEFVTLLGQPWFRRIWVLQEVALARGLVFLYGQTERTEAEFFQEYKRLTEDTIHKQHLHHATVAVVDLIERRADFKSGPGRSHLGQLLDMFHTHEATDRRDKVYALLGISSEYRDAPDIKPNYTKPWPQLLQDLTTHIFGPYVTVDTRSAREQAIICGTVFIFGRIFMIEGSGFRAYMYGWAIPSYAKHIEIGDLVCLVKGASRFSIIRPCNDHFDIIVASLPPPLQDGYQMPLPSLMKYLAEKRTTTTLVWDWDILEAEKSTRHADCLSNSSVFAPSSSGSAMEIADEKFLKFFVSEAMWGDHAKGLQFHRSLLQHGSTSATSLGPATNPSPRKVIPDSSSHTSRYSRYPQGDVAEIWRKPSEI